jgi:hypothetical protein
MGSAAPLEGVAATALAVAAIRAGETARPDRLFANPLAEGQPLVLTPVSPMRQVMFRPDCLAW